MASILIVDDERIERESVKTLLNRCGFSLTVFEANNGRKALEIMASVKIDILLTDIKMPFVNGIDLAAQTNIMNPNVKIIIFSAYGEFDLAQKAINSNVLSYLLKPVDPDEFRAAIQKAVDEYNEDEERAEYEFKLERDAEKARQYDTEALLIDLLFTKAPDDDMMKHIIPIIPGGAAGPHVIALVNFETGIFSRSGDRDLLMEQAGQAGITCEYVNLHPRTGVLFIWNTDMAKDQSMLDQFGNKVIAGFYDKRGIKPRILFSKTISGIGQFSEEYEQLESMLETGVFILDSNLIYRTGQPAAYEFDPGFFDKIVNMISTSLDYKNREYVKENIERAFDYIKRSNNISIMYNKHLCVEIYKLIYSKIQYFTEAEKLQEAQENLLRETDLDIVKRYLFQILNVVRADWCENRDSASWIVQKAKTIIENEYMNDLTLESIAARVYITPNYLCHIFKKETGRSFLRNVTDYRMKKAHELVANTEMRVTDVCIKVGYSKLSHFCAVFKQYYGSTPARYRENLGGVLP